MPGVPTLHGETLTEERLEHEVIVFISSAEVLSQQPENILQYLA